MKQEILDIIKILLVSFIILIALTLFASWISRAQVYSNNESRMRLERCLGTGLTFPECYHGVYDGFANFQINSK